MATSFLNDPFLGRFSSRGISERKLYLADLASISSTNGRQDISQFVTQMSVNYTMDMASQITFEIVDKDLKMAERNYFILGRDVIYETQTISSLDASSSKPTFVSQLFEIAQVSSSQGPGGSVMFSVSCYTKAIQQMKRDKRMAGTIKGQGTAFVREAARRYGLKFYGQETTKKQTITKASGDKQAESLWNIIKRLADDSKFVVFEVDGYLVFASEEWLLYKWGIESIYEPKLKKVNGILRTSGKTMKKWVPLQFPNSGPGYRGRDGIFKLTEYPSLSQNENDPYAGEGSCTVERLNATQLRPGMTVYVGLIPNMSNYYLIDSVSFTELTPDPVSVTFRTPTKDEEKQTIKLLPLGKRYAQTSTNIPPADFAPIKAVSENATSTSGKPVVSPVTDRRIFPLPTSSSPYSYPTMTKANLTETLKSFRYLLGSDTSASTGDENCVISIGNINLWERPVLPTGDSPKNGAALTLEHMAIAFQSGGQWRAGIVPQVYTVLGSATFKTRGEVTAYINSVGAATFFGGTGKHLGIVSGATKERALLNARDYGFLIKRQQEEVLAKRFPDKANTPWTIPNTAGAADSVWPPS